MKNLFELDNPFWFSLQTRHQDIALRAGEVMRYPAEIAPFLAVENEDSEVETGLFEFIPRSESVYLLGLAPRVSKHWQLNEFPQLAQMICEQPIPIVDGPEVIELNELHRPDVLALTALVYPHYFRARTMSLGRYFGIYQGERLAAMIGERLGMHSLQEISAVCTHPDFNGLGFARRLLAKLSNDNLERGRLPFLHVSNANLRAKVLYEKLGYQLRRNIPFWSLQRSDPI